MVDRTLDAVVALPGVDAGLISLSRGHEEDSTHAAGLSEDEIARTLLHMPGHPDLRALEVIYRYRLEDVGEGSKLPRSALTVALRAEGETIGSLAAISRSAPAASPRASRMRSRRSPAGPAPALFNALRFTEARELAELDSLTGLHNRRLFYEFLAREIARARRYERYVSVIVFDLDDFKRINDRIGHLGGDTVLVEVADAVRSAVRVTDIPCRVGGDEFAVILPESSRDDAELLFTRIQTVISSRAIGQAGRLRLSAGLAELKGDDDSVSLFERADRALYSAKEAGKGRSIAASA